MPHLDQPPPGFTITSPPPGQGTSSESLTQPNALLELLGPGRFQGEQRRITNADGMTQDVTWIVDPNLPGGGQWFGLSDLNDPPTSTPSGGGFSGRPLSEELKILAEQFRLRGQLDTADRLFEAAQAELDREARAAEAEAGRAFEEEESQKARDAAAEQNRLSIEGQQRINLLNRANDLVI